MNQIHQIKIDDLRLSQIARGINPEGFEASCIAIELQELRETMKKRNTAEDIPTDDLIKELYDRSEVLIMWGDIDDQETTVCTGSRIQLRGLAAEIVTHFDVLAVDQFRAKERMRNESNRKENAEPTQTEGDGASVPVSPG